MWMAIIKNADGTVGNTITANKYLLDNNLDSKYRLLQSYSNTRNQQKLKNVGGIGKDHTEIADANSPNILNFISKLQ
jgi:hypothetical protein